jgi:hypothetical protein
MTWVYVLLSLILVDGIMRTVLTYRAFGRVNFYGRVIVPWFVKLAYLLHDDYNPPPDPPAGFGPNG